MHGRHIARGDWLMLCYLSGNRDEEAFEQPERFRVTSTGAARGLWVRGAHACLGQHLARLEMRILFEELFSRVAWIEMAGVPRRLASIFLGGPKTLPVRFAYAVTRKACNFGIYNQALQRSEPWKFIARTSDRSSPSSSRTPFRPIRPVGTHRRRHCRRPRTANSPSRADTVTVIAVPRPKSMPKPALPWVRRPRPLPAWRLPYLSKRASSTSMCRSSNCFPISR